MPAQVEFLIRHVLVGFAIGLAAVVWIVWQDVGRIGTLIETSSERWLALGSFSLMFGSTFGAVQVAFAIMLASADD